MQALTCRILLVIACLTALGAAPAYSANPKPSKLLPSARAVAWPTGTEVLGFENLEGIILLRGTLLGAADTDTTGPLALDTGAGYLALDVGLARELGLADSTHESDAVDLTERPLPRLTLGGWSLEHVAPVLTVDGEVVRRVSDRPVLGLIGARPFGGRVVWIDYRDQTLALIPSGEAVEPGLAATDSLDDAGRRLLREHDRRAPPERRGAGTPLERSRALLATALSRRAIPVPFRLLGDGKVLVTGLVSDPTPPRFSRPLNLLVDTGATKCVLFEDSLEPSVAHAASWPALRGLTAPTLIGTVAARIARVPLIEILAADGPVRAAGVDVGVIRSDLEQVLSRVTREHIHGLLGYSFLKRFRLALDYPHRILWLDPIPGYRDDRPNEYTHVGLQLERQDGAVVVMGVVEGSPAARAGISVGDEVMAIDGTDARTLDLLELTRRMEGSEGRALTLVIRRHAAERTVRLVRRRLL